LFFHGQKREHEGQTSMARLIPVPTRFYAVFPAATRLNRPKPRNSCEHHDGKWKIAAKRRRSVARGASPHCYTQVGTRLSVPEGRSTVAQRFIAGKAGNTEGVFKSRRDDRIVILAPFSAVPPGRDSFFRPIEPSDKSLGYCQMPLRGRPQYAFNDLCVTTWA
jgi:hypothetical protein